MGLRISGLNELRERLERLRPEEMMARALADQAERMAAQVREGLSEPPDTAGHDEPWLRSGTLRDSVGAQTDGLQAVVGSNDPAAVPQEMGTVHMPPRPFLAPVGAMMAEEVAEALGMAVTKALRGDDSDEHTKQFPTETEYSVGIDDNQNNHLKRHPIHNGSKAALAAGTTEMGHRAAPTFVSATMGFASGTPKGGVVPVASADDPQGTKMASAAARQAGLTTKKELRRFHDLITGQGITEFSELVEIAKSVKEGDY